MKQPIWKKALSYILDVQIESSSSNYNPELYVQLVKGRYQLCTQNAIYSYADKYENFFDLFKKMNLPSSSDKPVNILILGFGLGSIPYMLEKKFHKDYYYTGVEIDEEVTYLATKYVLDELSSKIQLITADAFQYMHINEDAFDIIAMDVFESDIIPEHFESTQFLEQLKNSLTEDGLIIYNRLYQTQDENKTNAFFEGNFKTVFKNGIAIELEGNKMLLNTSKYLR